MENSNIEWCDHTFNPWEGCTKVSPGCAHCYAETRNARFGGGQAPNWGKGAPRRRTSQQNWNQPLRWDRAAAKASREFEYLRLVTASHPIVQNFVVPLQDAPRRPRVFCASLADWLDDEVPIEWLADLLALIRRTPNLDWLLLTKRPQNWKSRLDDVCSFEPIPDEDYETYTLSDWISDWWNGKAPANVWIGTTVEDQQRADERIPELVNIPAKVRFLSCEPFLGPMELDDVPLNDRCFGPWDFPKGNPVPGIHWVICGGESGPGARPMHPDWARSLRDQCKSAGVPFFFKQFGEWVEIDAAGIERQTCAGPDGETALSIDGRKPAIVMDNMARVGKKAAGRLLDGVEHNEFPDANL